MKIAIIGGGGREHALAWKLNQSDLCSGIFCIPGNGGTKSIATNVEIDIPVSIDQLPEGSYTSIQASFKIPENLTVTGVDFNSDNIEGISTYSYSNNQLILDVEGDQVNFSHQSSDIFATIKLEVNQAITSDRTDLLRLNYLNVTGDEVVYNVHDAVATIELINPSNHSQGDELAQTSSNLYSYLHNGLRTIFK